MLWVCGLPSAPSHAWGKICTLIGVSILQQSFQPQDDIWDTGMTWVCLPEIRSCVITVVTTLSGLRRGTQWALISTGGLDVGNR